MKYGLCPAAIGLLVLLPGCQSQPPTQGVSLVRDVQPSPGFDTTGADCAGRLYRDSATAVSGTSECRNGATVFFSGNSNLPLAEDLSCDYALTYTGERGGTGRISCTDGNTGDFVFEETDSTHGVATARMKDGREIKLTYTQAVR